MAYPFLAKLALWVTLLLIATDAPAQTVAGRAADTTAFDAFVAWVAALPPDDFKPLPQLLANYRSVLIAQGRSEAEAGRTTQEFWRVAVSHSPSALALEALAYNKIYAATKPIYNEGPNKLLLEVVETLKPGTALDVSMGQGRNSILLASRGWDVTGFDIAAGGLEKARARADQLGLHINTAKASAEAFDWGTERWDLIVMTYASNGPVERALKPGGTVVIETFLAERDAPNRNPEAIGPNDLLKRYPSLRVLRYEDVTTKSDWSPRPEAHICRLVARKEK
jgi:SAM-dependent methyltransferase